ncbi:MAG: DHH family phosphoesterase [bacterium]
MALDTGAQINKLIDQSHYILVCFSEQSDIDAIAASMAMRRILIEKSKQKQVDIFCENFSNHKRLNWLDDIDEIKPKLTHLQKFTIKVDVSDAKIDTLSYDIKDGWLSIHLNPKNGTISKKELRTAQTSFKYDLIITINCPDLESLGSAYSANTDLFYRLPIINIDHEASNERYGAINLVDVTSASSCQTIFQITKQISGAQIDEKIATILLSGIISKTRSFKTSNITPNTLNIASELMKIGADREKIIRGLYYNKTMQSLKIWGTALSRLQSEPGLGLVWTTITKEDFINSGASERELNEVVDELIANSPEAKTILLLYENENDPNRVHCVVSCNHENNAIDIARKYNAIGNKSRAKFSIENKSLTEARQQIIADLKKSEIISFKKP